MKKIFFISVFCATSLLSAEVVNDNIAIKGTGFSGDGKAFVSFEKGSAFNVCTTQSSGGWMFVPSEKVMSLLLTAVSTGKPLKRVVFTLRGGTNLVEFAHHGWADCELQAVSME